MMRTVLPRSRGGLVAATLLVVAGMLLSGLSAATAVDDPEPTGPTSGATGPVLPEGPTTSDGTDAADDSPTGDPSSPESPEAPQSSPSAPATLHAMVPPQIAEDTPVRIKEGSVRTTEGAIVDVLKNDSCNGHTPCRPADLDPSYGQGGIYVWALPPGWTATHLKDARGNWTGRLAITIPAGTPEGSRGVYYGIRDKDGHTAGGPGHNGDRVVVYPARPSTPKRYNVTQGSTFSHAFTSTKHRIRTHVINTIDSVPRGGQIRILSWSFSSKQFRNALIRAKNRGVSVQIILAERNTKENSDWPKLVKAFGGNRWGKNADTGSWVYKCSASCRGTGGTMHSKVFIFSHVGAKAEKVVMTGSGNLTNFAGNGQWNQMYTTVGNTDVYNEANWVFYESKRDVRASPVYRESHFGAISTYFMPMTSGAESYDAMATALKDITCTGTETWKGVTRIRIAMYVWRQSRGEWLARIVRRLWNQGCDIQIIYAMMSNQVKGVLYSPSGRGRIPMRQILLADDEGVPEWYTHNKYVTIAGQYGADKNYYGTYQGSFNFSNLGMYSDENWERILGYGTFVDFLTDFNQMWGQGSHARAPSPTSQIAEGSLERLGTGVYRNMEPD